MDTWLQDLRYGWRLLIRRPGFTIAAGLTLALGVGASTAVFSAVNALLLRPLPVVGVERLVFGMALREGFDPFGTSLLEYALYRDQARSLESSGLGTPRLFSLLGRGEPERVRGAAVTASYLSTLQVAPALGRLFSIEAERPGAEGVALLGHGLWQRRFGSDPGVVGQALSFEGRSYTVLGVMPPGFDLPYSAEMWVPMQVAIESLPFDQGIANSNEFVARLKPGIDLKQADTELKGLALRLAEQHPQARRGWSFGLVPLRHQLLADLEGRTQRSLVALSVAVGFLLLICCANVASLLLARGVGRQAEIATRLSLGAGRGRVVRQLLTEGTLLALLGGALGLLLAYGLQPLLRSLNPIQAIGLGSQLTDFRIDARVLLFALALTLVTGALFGLLPALTVAGRGSLVDVLKRSGQRGVVGHGSRRPLRALVAGEIAVAASLLVGGGLMAQSLQRLQALDLGFRPDRLLTLELPLSGSRHAERDQQVLLMEQLLERVRSVPGVAAAGMTLNVPMQRGVTLDSVFEAEGAPPPNADQVPITAHRLVSPGYLETLGVTLRKGRLLDPQDTAQSPPVAVVSAELARQAWPGADPIGKRVRRVRAGVRGPWMSVVGVVDDVKEDRFGFRIDRPVWYLPYSQQTFPVPVSLPLNMVVRSEGEPTRLAAAVRTAIHGVDAELPVASVMPMREYLADVLVGERFSAALMTALAGLGLLLAAIGLYGVLAYTVGQRTGEIGLRMALGARPRDVERLVIVDAAGLLAIGLGLGVVGAWGLTRLLRNALFEVSPSDPWTFAAVVATLLIVALAACALPARRAARVSPMVSLRLD